MYGLGGGGETMVLRGSMRALNDAPGEASMKLGRPLVRGAQVAAAKQRAGAQEDRMEVASPSPRPWRLLGCEGPLHAGLGFSA